VASAGPHRQHHCRAASGVRSCWFSSSKPIFCSGGASHESTCCKPPGLRNCRNLAPRDCAQRDDPRIDGLDTGSVTLRRLIAPNQRANAYGTSMRFRSRLSTAGFQCRLFSSSRHARYQGRKIRRVIGKRSAVRKSSERRVVGTGDRNGRWPWGCYQPLTARPSDTVMVAIMGACGHRALRLLRIEQRRRRYEWRLQRTRNSVDCGAEMYSGTPYERSGAAGHTRSTSEHNARGFQVLNGGDDRRSRMRHR